MKKALLIILLAAWWHLLIWEAQLGLNVLLFSVSIIAVFPGPSQKLLRAQKYQKILNN